MAVYTDLAAHELGAIVDGWDVGRLVSAKGIAEGISNSNWLIETAGSPRSARFVLTMYERRIDPALPAFTSKAADLAERWPQNLPVSVIHADLFPDNVLMVGDSVTGVIDFYFACTDQMAYDLAVTHSAWAFDRRTGAYREDIGRALIEGYGSVRDLLPAERSALPLLAQGACLRFVASRVEDWFEQAGSHEILRKDPLDYARRWQFYESQGNAIFA